MEHILDNVVISDVMANTTGVLGALSSPITYLIGVLLAMGILKWLIELIRDRVYLNSPQGKLENAEMFLSKEEKIISLRRRAKKDFIAGKSVGLSDDEEYRLEQLEHF